MAKVELHFRFGDHKIAPADADLERALAEIFRESALALSDADLAEHPVSWLTLGRDFGEKWTVLSVEIYRGGLAVLAKYADQDDADPEYEYRRCPVDETESLRLWELLSRGAESELIARFAG